MIPNRFAGGGVGLWAGSPGGGRTGEPAGVGVRRTGEELTGGTNDAGNALTWSSGMRQTISRKDQTLRRHRVRRKHPDKSLAARPHGFVGMPATG